ncbi:MAG: hypothetical protein R6W86_09155 [Marinobacter sp.]|uniref:hypothetical protein n=1 Tax=Marinobacter sp. TaxID=50741 RepID=UPI00396D30AE
MTANQPKRKYQLPEEEKTPTVNEAQGIYKGITDTGRRLVALALDGGDHAFLYGREGVNEFLLSGTILGNATASQEAFTSTGATSLNFIEQSTSGVSITANYVVGQYLTESIEVPGADSVEITSSYEDDYNSSPYLTASSGNLFDVSVSFAKLDCRLLANQTLTGVAYHDGENFRLYIAAPTEDRQGGLSSVDSMMDTFSIEY